MARINFYDIHAEPSVLFGYNIPSISHSTHRHARPDGYDAHSVTYRLNGRLHRDDGPAYTCDNGEQVWYQHGRRHREGGPAQIDGVGETWYRHGVVHRDGGPARIYKGGGETWLQNGKPHRDGAPATTMPDGSEFWYQHGDLHREDGPAVKRWDRSLKVFHTQWWKDGRRDWSREYDGDRE